MIRAFTIPDVVVEHPTILVPSGDSAPEAAKRKPYAWTFDDFFVAVMGDRWWRGEGSANRNDVVARTDAALRILAAYQSRVEGVVQLADADLDWLIDRAAAFQLPHGLAAMQPGLLKFFRAVLGAMPLAS